jgi:hypothetical protein
MPPTIGQLDAANIKKQIKQPHLAIEERIRLCELLLELYPSRRNKQAVNKFLRAYPGGKNYGAAYDLKMRVNAEAIAKHREIILANRKAIDVARKMGAPSKTVAIAPGDDGHSYYVDKNGKVLGQVPPKPEVVEEIR